MEPKITIGILAHVDAGKTTLSEQILLYGKSIRKAGRVDHGDSFLDTGEMERKRGITITSKPAEVTLSGKRIVLLDTPGHTDLSAEMERALSVMDYAILLISAPDGVTGYTKTLWELLKIRKIPTFIFVNKTDRFAPEDSGALPSLLSEIKGELSGDIMDFTGAFVKGEKELAESIAMTDEKLLDEFLSLEKTDIEGLCPVSDEQHRGFADTQTIARLIRAGKLFPCFFGSALKDEGIAFFLDLLSKLVLEKSFHEQFGARIYKVSRDEDGNRLLHIRMTGGTLAVRDILKLQPVAGAGDVPDGGEAPLLKEKVSQIRIYSGAGFESVREAQAGDVAVLLGISGGRAGDGLGFESEGLAPERVPVLSYKVVPADDTPLVLLFEKIRLLSEENPELSPEYNEETGKIGISLMGQVQAEIFTSQMESRFGMKVRLEEGDMLYRETIDDKVEGVGHFEPLRHYAEVHLILEPGQRGSGMVFATKLSSDLLATNWKRLIMQHLLEKQHRGVLTGAPVTDMKITLVAGRAHPKHTEGGDFRQATYRAVRQGLMQAKSLLLEPVFNVSVTVPSAYTGRVLSDLDRFHGSGSVAWMNETTAHITGRAPVACIRNYAADLYAFTSGEGVIELCFGGYDVCHNTEQVVERFGYDPERDTRNRADSVFCKGGSSVIIPWNEVGEYMHLPYVLQKERGEYPETMAAANIGTGRSGKAAGEDELKEIFERTYKTGWDGKRDRVKDEDSRRRVFSGEQENGDLSKRKNVSKPALPAFLLVDGYNVIFKDEKLSSLAADNLDAAREGLLHLLSDFHGTRDGKLTVVFDAYKTQDQKAHTEVRGNIDVVYTGKGQTADMYIERTVKELRGRYAVTVATSDGLEQVISRGQGALLISSGELLRLMRENAKEVRNELENKPAGRINPIVIPPGIDPD
ncbi:MAG: NYN domain-containing protein [Lachnospiraceae bacterium]|nr:NYN domain-containing protein [Lachnospiraceae bacterium]